MNGDGHKTSAGATSAPAARADDLQYQLYEGPCLTACRTQQVVRIDDLEHDDRWPHWQAAILLANVATLDRADRLSEQLQEAPRARNAIALANGILMERHSLTEEQAFLRLVEQARAGQHELVDQAADAIRSTAHAAE